MTTNSQRSALADAFNRDIDPLAQFETQFEQIDIDPFELYIDEVLSQRDIVDDTRKAHIRTFDQWRTFMDSEGRHAACPSADHVLSFVAYERDEKENIAKTIKRKLWNLSKVYEFWQNDPAFPHPQDFNPFDMAYNRAQLSSQETKQPHRISIERLGELVRKTTNIRNRVIISLQLKLGLRVNELCNIKVEDVSITNAEVQRHYDDLGTHDALADRDNAIYIPHDREGNKSKRPRVLPLDDELRTILVEYLLIRCDNNEPWLLLSDTRRIQMGREAVNDVWKDVFYPQYDETAEHKAVTSHYGRHRFTTFWRVEKDLNRELIKYMRGDTLANGREEAIDSYIHTYYEDILEIYTNEIYKFGFSA